MSMTDNHGKTATATLVEQFRRDIGDVPATTDARQLRIKSHDFHWYSPILTPQLQNCRADIVVQPRSEQEIGTVAAAAARRMPPIRRPAAKMGMQAAVEAVILSDTAAIQEANV